MTDRDRPEVVEQFNELGQLASGVGHHVINAFSAIVSNAELLRLSAKLPNPVDPLAVADTIIRTALDASTVARRLIDFSRMATAFSGEPIALDRLAASVAEAERGLQRPGISWSTELQPVPPISGDETQLRAMIGHLITNAREAMPPSGGTIALATSCDERGWVVLEVRDTGRGMLPHAQERAVEPFFTTKGGHVGVGLSIAHGIWRRHGGTLAIRSQPGEGTRVRLFVEPIPEPPPTP